MSRKFNPVYQITPAIAKNLMQIEAVRERIAHLPVTPKVLSGLRESARLYSTHYSTMIEGNRLDIEQVEGVIKHKGHFPGRERDEREVKGYYAALTYVEQLVAKDSSVTEKAIQTIHARAMSSGLSSNKVTPTSYRDGQNVIRDGRTRTIIYLPPEAADVPSLMKELVQWIDDHNALPAPIVAGIAHYQFATIHPYYDGNGRTARLLTTWVLHHGGYGLKGLYSLEEYYARNLDAYYEAIAIGTSHNYYEGRAQADITPWLEYFIRGVAVAFKNVLKHMTVAAAQESQPDVEELLAKLDPKQRAAFDLLQNNASISAQQIGGLFGFKPRTASALCKKWVDTGFLEIVDASKKNRRYRLSSRYR